ncbi:hypothetical protein [Allosphingosinicella humi]
MATTGQIAESLAFREPGWSDQPASVTDLARGLMLLRASNMNVIRLQLAMERSDRRTAMEALDDLVALDREIGGFIGEPPDPELSEMARHLDSQKTVIASEKLVFAAGKRGPIIAPGSQVPPPATPAEIEPGPEEIAAYADPMAGLYADEEAVPRRTWRILGILFLTFVALGLAAALYLAITNQLPSADDLARIMEML